MALYGATEIVTVVVASNIIIYNTLSGIHEA